MGVESDEAEIRRDASDDPLLSFMAATMSRFCSTGISSSKRLSGTRTSERYQGCLEKTVLVAWKTSPSGYACKVLNSNSLFGAAVDEFDVYQHSTHVVTTKRDSECCQCCQTEAVWDTPLADVRG